MMERSGSLKAIVAYKGLAVLGLLTISLISALSWRNYTALATITQEYLTEGNFGLIEWFIDKILRFSATDLRLIAHASGIYALITAIATTGLWYGKEWAKILMLSMVGFPLPVEIYETTYHFSPDRLVIFVLNLLVLIYLVKHKFSQRKKAIILL